MARDYAADITDPIAQEIVSNVGVWVDREVKPVAMEYEHADQFPDPLVKGMSEMGLFGIKIPEAYGGLDLSFECYAGVCMELARGWMSLAGIINTHVLVGYAISEYGTEEQKQKYLPKLVEPEIRCALTITEPDAGSDAQAIKTTAVRDGDDYIINGQKMWVTNGHRAGVYLAMTKTDTTAVPRHKGITAFLVDAGHTIFQDGNIGGGAAHIENERILCPRQKCSADDAGSRSGQNGFDGFFLRLFFSHQRPVPFDNHNCGVDTSFFQGIPYGYEQFLDDRHQAGIENGGNGSFVHTQRAGEVMAANYRNTEDFPYQLLRSQFMLRIAHTQIAGNGDGVHLSAHFLDGSPGRLFVKGFLLTPLDIVTAGNCGNDRRRQGMAGGKSDHKESDLAAPAFNDGIGSQGGGQGYDMDFGKAVEVHCIDTISNADTQIFPCGKGFCFGDDFSVRSINDHTVGIRTACIDAKYQ